MRLYFCLMLIIALCGNNVAQQPTLPLPPDGLKHQVSYTVEETVFHRVPQSTPLSSLSVLDKQKTRKFREVKQVTFKTEDDGTHGSVTVVLNPEEAYEEWPNPIGRTEVDAQGTRSFSPDGALLNTTPADSAYTARYQSIKSELQNSVPKVMYHFPLPGTDLLTNLQNDGWAVINLPNNGVQVQKGGQTIVYEPNVMQITTSKYQGDLLESRHTLRYQISTQGILVPVLEIKEEPIIRPSGACMERVRIKRYENYQVAVKPVTERSGASDAQFALSLWPNPVSEVVTVSFDKTVQVGAKFYVTDVAGRNYFQTTVKAGDTKVELSVKDQPNGVYFANIETLTGLKVFKFVKQ
jgi:hypothetical protein